MTFVNQEFQKHIKKINNNDFIYKHKIAFYLLSEQQLKLYEAGFKVGFELPQQKMSNHISEIKKNNHKHVTINIYNPPTGGIVLSCDLETMWSAYILNIFT